MLETTNDDYFIHKFYNTIDLFLHYRKDGECHSTAISQALSYGVPVISHYAGQNGQSETIRDGGFVVNNESEYLDRIIYLIENKEVYDKISNNALIRSQDFDEKKITERWEQIYLQEHNNK
jgi:glycosyltransferase involved in cell wall biosynthesis